MVSTRRPAAAIIACLVFGATSAVVSAATQPQLSDYRITSWTGGDGVTLGEVRSIQQDAQGYLWLASEAGLVRFDGARFCASELVTGPTLLPNVPSKALALARDGSLWVGYDGDHGLYHIVAGRVQAVHLRGEVTGYIYSIFEDQDGAVWVGDDGGLHRYDQSRWERIAFAPQTARSRRVYDIHRDRAGRLWLASAAGLYVRRADGGFELAPLGAGIHRALEEDATGQLWTTDDRAGYRPVDKPAASLFEARGMNVLHDSRGNVWVTTIGQGIWQVKALGPRQVPRISRASARSGLANDEMSAMLEDRHGNIWIASIRGLARLAPHAAQPLTDIGVVRALSVGRDGLAWAATSTGLRLLSEGTSGAPEAQLLAPQPVRTVHVTSKGTVWAATSEGLHRVAGRQLGPALAVTRGFRRITSITSTGDTLWLCDEDGGLLRLDDGQLVESTSLTAGLAAKPIFAHADGRERLWVAFDDGMVKSLDKDGHIRRYGREEGLSHSRVTVIHHDRWGDVWIGGNAGLSLVRNDRVETISFRQLVGTWSVSAVLDDDRDNVWIAVAFFGLIRANRSDLVRAIRGDEVGHRFHVYEMGGGMGYPDLSPGVSGGRGNRVGSDLWFLTSAGATLVDPAQLVAGDREPGRPLIESVVADGRRYGHAADVSLPGGTSRVQIEFTRIDLSSPPIQTRFRYRLDGFDQEWVDGASTRMASYTNLPPGSYRFRLQASVRGAEWDGIETQMPFAVQPMFHQTRMFYALSACALLLAAVSAWRVRLGAVRREMALRSNERVRLSREIHDTLLQSLVGLSLQIDSAARDVEGRPTRTREQLVAMRRQIEGYIRETRQSIWDLRSPQLDRDGIVGTLRSIGERLTADRVPFSLMVTGTPRACPPKVETSVVRVGHEALTNAVRHAGAKHVQLEVGFHDSRIQLRVRDDGCGFEPRLVPLDGASGHYGILGMKERVQDLGGTFTVESVPGFGAQVVAEFPLPPRG